MERIPVTSNWARIGAKTGAAVAQPWHRAVDLLQHEKLQEIERRNAIKNRNAEMENYVEQSRRFGMPESFINASAPQRPEDRFKAMQFGPQFEQYNRMEKQEQALAMFEDAWNKKNQQAQHQQGVPQGGGQQGFMAPLMGEQQGQMQGQMQQGMQQSPTGAQSEPDMQNEALQAAGMRPTAGNQDQGSMNPFTKELNALRQQKQALLGDAYKDPRLKQQEEQFDRKFEQTRKENARKETKGLRDKISNENKASKENMKRLNEMERLTKEGDLSDNSVIELLRHFDIDFNFLKTPDDETYQKLEKDFLKNMREVFGGRVAVEEMKAFLQTIPSLSNSKDGRLQIIKNFKAMEKAKQIRYKAMEQVYRENENDYPEDLEFQINEREDNMLDKEAAKFSKLADQGLYLAVEQDPEKYAHLLPEGTTADDNGIQKIIRNGKWERM